MFRIARVRIRWINTNQLNADVVLTTQSVQTVGNILIRRLWALNPRNWRVRVSWVGFGSTASALNTVPVTKQMSSDMMSISPPIRVLGTFNMPKMNVRVSWIGLASTNRVHTWALGLFIVLLSIFAFRQLTHVNPADQPVEAETVLPAGLITDEISLGDETIRMTHSTLDIGQSKDIFDNNIDTLIRGLEANPFILDFEFSKPQAIKGLMMDFGRMDFVMRVQVYGTGNTSPISYKGEYRQQPPIPHMDMDFVNGPEQVKRIYIEIEQLLPPEEVHIHVREVVFKK
jgi:hypothetical protein